MKQNALDTRIKLYALVLCSLVCLFYTADKLGARSSRATYLVAIAASIAGLEFALYRMGQGGESASPESVPSDSVEGSEVTMEAIASVVRQSGQETVQSLVQYGDRRFDELAALGAQFRANNVEPSTPLPPVTAAELAEEVLVGGLEIDPAAFEQIGADAW